MDISLFDFHLPATAIAQMPVNPRDSAKLLDVTASHCTDTHVYDLPKALRSGDILVFNDTKVFNGRLTGTVGAATVHLLVHRAVTATQWWAMVKNARRLKQGTMVTFAPDLSATVLEKRDDGQVLFDFTLGGADDSLFPYLQRYGALPLPPYIKRLDGVLESDTDRYQTIYAKHMGAVAAPTAGLHFTDALLAQLVAMGVQMVFLTLHVGLGTFLPVKVDVIEDHVMHGEYGVLDAPTAHAINAAKQAGGRVIAVGTTALRLMESAADAQGIVHPFTGETHIYITPPYRFKVVDMLFTNFHLPKSTLFILVSAFMGLDRMQQAYAHAIHHGYRFFSYGDACLLHRHHGSD